MSVRCFTCGSVIGHLHDEYDAHLARGLSKLDAVKQCHVERPCCRARIMGTVKIDRTIFIHNKKIDPSQLA